MLKLFNAIMKFINNHFPGRGKDRKVETIDASGSVWDKPAESSKPKDEKPN